MVFFFIKPTCSTLFSLLRFENKLIPSRNLFEWQLCLFESHSSVILCFITKKTRLLKRLKSRLRAQECIVFYRTRHIPGQTMRLTQYIICCELNGAPKFNQAPVKQLLQIFLFNSRWHHSDTKPQIRTDKQHLCVTGKSLFSGRCGDCAVWVCKMLKITIFAINESPP